VAKLLFEEGKKAWKIVHSLNVEAAENIFKVKNQNNGLLKIDLHGLHRLEAIEAVKQRLKVIEANSEIWLDSSDDSNLVKPIWLEVITGIYLFSFFI
jgi:hypothetical protein